MKKDIGIEIKGDIEKHISDLMQKHFAKLNGELILMTGTIKMLAMAGETGKIIEICDLMLDKFNEVAQHNVQRTGLCPEHRKPINSTGLYYECGCPV